MTQNFSSSFHQFPPNYFLILKFWTTLHIQKDMLLVIVLLSVLLVNKTFLNTTTDRGLFWDKAVY